MSTFSGVINLNASDMKKDKLVLTGDKETLAIILTLVDPSLIISPNVTNAASLLRHIKSGVSSITIALGNSGIPKNVLLEALNFCEVK